MTTTIKEPRVCNIKLRDRQWLEVMYVELVDGEARPTSAQSIPSAFDTIEGLNLYIEVLREAASKPPLTIKLQDPQLH